MNVIKIFKISSVCKHDYVILGAGGELRTVLIEIFTTKNKIF